MNSSSKKLVVAIFVSATFLVFFVVLIFRQGIISPGSGKTTFVQEEILQEQKQKQEQEESEKTHDLQEKTKLVMETPLSPTSPSPLFNIFEKATIEPEAFLDGAGENIDSPEFFETDDPKQSLLLVSGKKNDTIEVWKYPFLDQEQKPLETKSSPNGLAIDQTTDWLLVGLPSAKRVDVYSLPELEKIKTIGENILGSGETNVDVLTQPSGRKILYVTESHLVRGFDLESGEELVYFSPQVREVEEILADSFHQIIYVPEEVGSKSPIHPGGAITAYLPDGTPFEKNGSNIFGQGLFHGDGEGIALYKCLDKEDQDTGHGFIISADQSGKEDNGFEFFNRETWKHLGTLKLKNVSKTDGITSTQIPFPKYPMGLFAVADSDKETALVSWERIFEATGLSCD